ncbi:MAG: hypothetical protein HY901_20700 [Deltaproteobacteria bacterium]|nr:hypothetical protein [Deltaproteobacteria bacterium]
MTFPRSRHTTLAAVLLASASILGTGCGEPAAGSDSGISPPASDASVTQDAGLAGADALIGPLPDAAQLAADSGAGSLDAGAGADIGSPGSDAGDSDGGLAFWDPQGPGGQCVEVGHCFFSATCVMSAPGGMCQGCAYAEECGDAFEMDCVDGVCRRLCGPNTRCPRGLRCVAGPELSTCALIPCGQGKPACPSPYVCEDETCARPKCAAQEPVCPAAMYCSDESYCVENYE